MTDTTRDRLLAIVNASVGDFLTQNAFGEPLLRLSEATDEQLSAIKEIYYKQDGAKIEFKIVMHDKIAAMKALQP